MIDESPITFSRIHPSSRFCRVALDGATLPIWVRIDVDAFFYVLESVSGREIARVDMADDHPRLKLETAIRLSLETGSHRPDRSPHSGGASRSRHRAENCSLSNTSSSVKDATIAVTADCGATR